MADQPTEARLALYRKLSTEHLQTLLRSDLDGPPLDEATVDSILTVLAERRRTPADTSAAWQDFSAYYSTPDSPGAPVRRTRAHLQKAYTRLRIPIRVVSAAAAMFILIFALFPRVETGASDAPNAYITWTDEYLKIDALPHAGWNLPQGGEYHTDNAGLQQLHDALAAYGVTGVVPSWVPEGAVLAEYDFGDEFAGTTSFYAFFSLPDGTGFSMDFTIFAEPSAMEGSWIVKDERPVSYFTLGGRRVLPIHEQCFHGHLLAERLCFRSGLRQGPGGSDPLHCLFHTLNGGIHEARSFSCTDPFPAGSRAVPAGRRAQQRLHQPLRCVDRQKRYELDLDQDHDRLRLFHDQHWRHHDRHRAVRKRDELDPGPHLFLALHGRHAGPQRDDPYLYADLHRPRELFLPRTRHILRRR